MKIAIIGSGGREHALAWKLAQSVNWENIYVLPGNGGIPRSFSVSISDFSALEAYCRQEGIGFIVVGPEVPLSQGIVDYFRKTDILIFGPTQAAAIMEGSKIYAKQFMQKHHVSTADFQLFNTVNSAIPYIQTKNGNCVIKYDGLAAGKGVFVCNNIDEADEALSELRTQYGEEVSFLVEDKLLGDEISIIGITDGKTIRLLPPSQDHKQLNDNDLGPNTGGMGAFCPVPFYTDILAQAIDKDIVQPTLLGIQAEVLDYKGFLYFGIMITTDGVKLLEYNARLGDPETEVLLPALKSDLAEVLLAALDGSLATTNWEFNEGYFVDVVQVSAGYPKAYTNGFAIQGIENLDTETLVFYAGVKKSGELLVSNGGRVLNIVAQGKTLAEAIEKAYTACEKVRFDGHYYRKDIGKRKSNL